MTTLYADGFRVPFPRSTFGNRFGVHDIIDGRDVYGPEGHRGTDFIVPEGTPVPSPANARVERILWSNAIGNVMVLRHFLPGDGNDIYTGIAHLSATTVKEGRWVKAGQAVARSGETGSVCFGPHVHMTMGPDITGVISGRVFDPLEFIAEHAVITPPNASAKFTTARRGEGLSSIAARSGLSLTQIKDLNRGVRSPDYIVMLGQRIRIA